jgi:uncharacterized membrane protein YoaK (UPF0700 family)
VPRTNYTTICEDLGLAFLSIGAGCTDVLVFLKLGDLFTSAMTGNTALLAIALGSGHLRAASRALCALIGFALGVVLATVISAPWRAQEEDRRAVLRRLLPLELVFLGGCAALWGANPHSMEGVVLYAVIALSALSMGIQSVVARHSNSSGISTIVFTTNLINILIYATRVLANLPAAGRVPARAGAHVQAFAAYAGGAALAACLVYRWVETVIWIPFAVVLCAFGSFELAGRPEEKASR